MLRRPPRATRTDTPFPYTTLFRSMAGMMKAEANLTAQMGRFMAVFESYPDLKANQNMAQLMEELTSTENKISFARQAYNDAVRSEEHTSELQSLMRISYAVFCLNKKVQNLGRTHILTTLSNT